MHIGKIRVMIDRVTSRSKVVSEHSLSLSFSSGLSFSAVSVFDSALVPHSDDDLGYPKKKTPGF